MLLKYRLSRFTKLGIKLFGEDFTTLLLTFILKSIIDTDTIPKQKRKYNKKVKNSVDKK